MRGFFLQKRLLKPATGDDKKKHQRIIQEGEIEE